ncbi:MAG: penicillin acylase family protein, partial [Gemmataceae bacterium]|nr:penicillin acylase family protein [Gemmataceae bacterium]
MPPPDLLAHLDVMTWMSQFMAMVRDGVAVAARLAGALGLRQLILRPSLPPRHESRLVDGLHGPVTIRFDRWGVPHLEAADAADLFFGQGYCHARDRLWQMELNRRLARGELAEVFGGRFLELDRFLRRLGFRAAAEREVPLLRPETRRLSEAYSAGVNAYIVSHPRPIEFRLLRLQPRPWNVLDSLAFARLMALLLGLNWEMELIRARLVAAVGPERAAALELDSQAAAEAGVGLEVGVRLAAAQALRPWLDVWPGGGSNNWVVAGSRTVSGRPLLANDPHLRPRMPAAWYLMGLHGGGFDLAGASLPGMLGIQLGHNARIAWGITAALIDVQDLYLERLNPRESGSYLTPEGWQPLQVRREEIPIRGQAKPWIEEVPLTRHGPLLNGTLNIPRDGPGLALHHTHDDWPVAADALLAVQRANDWRTFRQALADWTFPVLNFIYADIDGHIGYQLAGRVPIRHPGSGYGPVPGWNGAHDWSGWVPFDDLPCVFDPPEGIWATANTRPAIEPLPLLTRDWIDDGRWRRIMELLRKEERHSLRSMKAMQADVVSLPARAIIQSLGDVVPRDDFARQVLELLKGWDGDLSAESVPAAVYEVYRRQLLERLAQQVPAPLRGHILGQGVHEALMSVSMFHFRGSSLLIGFLEKRATVEDRAAAFHAAVRWLREHLGPNPRQWAWGRIHTWCLMHPLGLASSLLDRFLDLSRGPFPVGGDADTIAQAGVDPWQPFAATSFAVSCRLIVDVGDWDRSCFQLPSGQSGQPGSRHYDDLLSAWLRGRYVPLLFSPRAIEQATKATVRLAPRPGGRGGGGGAPAPPRPPPPARATAPTPPTPPPPPPPPP